MFKTVFTLARFSLLEAIRTRTGWLALALLGLGTGLAWLTGQVAITETSEIQAVLTATFLRVAAVFLLIAFVATAQAREAADKSVDLLLSLPTPRSAYYIGKLLGYLGAGWLLALLFGLFLLLFAPIYNVVAWTFSLGLELSIVAAATLFFSTALTQTQATLAAAVGFYLLSRAMAAFRLIGGSSIVDDQSNSHAVIQWLIDSIAAVLPRLDLFTQSAWLVSAPGPLLNITVQAAIYIGLLSAAGLIDFYRKSF